jgi:hypothetical protein
LSKIKNDYPQLTSQVVISQNEFQFTFGKSCDHLGSLFSNEVKNKLKQSMLENVDFQNQMQLLTFEKAVEFIGSVRNRAKGTIDSPVKETLLSFNPDFTDNPSLEFLRGFTTKFRSQNHPKAKGLNVQIEVPTSWSAKEGYRPNIVQFFKSQNGFGNVYFALQIREFIPPKELKITQKDIDLMFTPKGLKDFIPDNATFIESKSINLDGEKGGLIVYDEVGERIDLRLKMRIASYITYYKNRLIFLQFSITNKEDEMQTTINEFNKNRNLFNLIANSFIIMDKYK